MSAPIRSKGNALGLVGGLLMILAGQPDGGTAGGGPLAPQKRPAEEDVWAIRCITVEGRDQTDRAQRFAEGLRQVDGLNRKLVQVLRDDDGTHVFYGRYRREYATQETEPKYKPDPRPDLEKIRNLAVQTSDGQTVWPFYLATLDVLPTYRSPHPEWNLEDADGYWALHVAVFYNTDDFRSRRWAAEEYCRLLREDGERAYYHHGPVNSSVYIGTFPEHSVVEVRDENPLSGQVRMVWRIVDPRVLKAQEKHPHSLHNGHMMYEIVRDRKSGEVRRRLPAPSFPVVIPKAKRAQESLEVR